MNILFTGCKQNISTRFVLLYYPNIKKKLCISILIMSVNFQGLLHAHTCIYIYIYIYMCVICECACMYILLAIHFNIPVCYSKITPTGCYYQRQCKT